MGTTYVKRYTTKDLFGESCPELIAFFAKYPVQGKVLDLGCGQGRNALPLARLGYSVIGVDNSHVGIGQMNQMAQVQNLNLVGRVTDMYTFEDFGVFDIILLDSMFHFTQKDREKEVGFVQKIVSRIRNGTLLVFCSQDSGHKVQILNNAIDFERPLERLMDKTFKYTFEDKESGHCSVSDYRMIMVKK